MLKCIYSMMPIVQINFLLYKTEAGKNRAGSRQDREREKGRSGLREQEMEHRRESETAWVKK